MVQWMETAKTHPNIVNLYATGLSSFYKDTNFLPPLTHWIYSDDQSINSALSSQINLGWMNTLTGLITEEMVNLQQNHYNHTSSSRKGSTWAKNMTLHIWNMLHKIWIFRNEALHNTQQYQVLSGLPLLKASVTREYNIGIDRLPQLYSSYFHIPLSTILSRSPSHLVKWFLVIRSARESYQPNLLQDEFSSNGPMRTWIGLPVIP